jgi:hypothetical protein
MNQESKWNSNAPPPLVGVDKTKHDTQKKWIAKLAIHFFNGG